MAVLTLSACEKKQTENNDKTPSSVNVDFASSVHLDMSSNTAKQEVTVHSFVDGDTTHFNVPAELDESGVLKARYLAVNTPESTGKIEEWGKKASRFTKETLSKATSIIIESEDSEWSLDSTGGRYLVWVWYKTADSSEYRNLNIELLQNGLAIASSSANNRYGETCVKAINQARTNKLNVYSGEKDPDYFYGDSVELTLKELRTNVEAYNGMNVAFDAVVTRNYDNTVYVEEYDAETGLYYGMTVYYGYGLSADGIDILSVGNRVRIVGSVQFYEAGGTWQISGLKYRAMKPDDPSNIQKLGSGYSAAFTETAPADFVKRKVKISVNDEEKEFDYAYLALSTSVSINDLTVKGIYTTKKEGSSSYGAMTLTCEAPDGTIVHVRTVPLLDGEGNLVTQEAYQDALIRVKGIVDYYNGEYQIKVLSRNDITVIR